MREALVLCYHAVSERWPAPLSVTPARLRKHLEVLSARGFQGVTFSEAVTAGDAKVAALTFDDAYRSVLELALPILAEAGFPATVFAPSAYIGSDEPMSWPGIHQWLHGEYCDELMPLSWEELEELAANGWEVGSHTCSHPHLPALDESSLDAELIESRETIADRLGSCDTIAYPYGSYDARVIEATRRAGYGAAGTLPIGPKWNGDGLEFPRVGVYSIDGERRFRAKISPVVRRVRATRVWTELNPGRLVAGEQPF